MRYPAGKGISLCLHWHLPWIFSRRDGLHRPCKADEPSTTRSWVPEAPLVQSITRTLATRSA